MNTLRHNSPWLRMTFLVLGMVCSASSADDSSLVLPTWSEEEIRAMQAHGAPRGLGILLNPNSESLEVAPFELADSPERAQPASDLSRFLPPSLMAPMRTDQRSRSRPSVTLVRVLHDVTHDFLAQAMQAPAQMMLIDPNGELHESAHEEFQRFLEFHLRDSRIAMHVLLMGKNEQLPPDTDLAPIAGGSLRQGRACVVVVPMGDATRTRLFLSHDVIEAAKGVDLTELLEDVVKQAKSSPEVDEQLHRLLVRLSVRLFWLERKLPAQEVSESVRPAIVVKNVNAAPLVEVGAQRAVAGSSSWLGFGLALLAFSGVGVFAYRRWRQHQHRTHEWLLPEPVRMEPTLGGMHGGSAAGVAWN